MQAIGTVLSVFGFDVISQTVSIAVAIVLAIGYFASTAASAGRCFFLLLVMILLATTELGVDSWVTDLMTPAFVRVRQIRSTPRSSCSFCDSVPGLWFTASRRLDCFASALHWRVADFWRCRGLPGGHVILAATL